MAALGRVRTETAPDVGDTEVVDGVLKRLAAMRSYMRDVNLGRDTQEGIAEAFTSRFAERAAQIRQGDPRDEETQIGPNIHLKHVERVQGFVDRARADGATIAYGGEVNADLGTDLVAVAAERHDHG